MFCSKTHNSVSLKQYLKASSYIYERCEKVKKFIIKLKIKEEREESSSLSSFIFYLIIIFFIYGIRA
jgi:hypothetical protein